MASISAHVLNSVFAVISECDAALGTVALVQKLGLVDFLQTDNVTEYSKAHRHLIGLLQTHSTLSAAFAQTLDQQQLLGVRNRAPLHPHHDDDEARRGGTSAASSRFEALIGNGTCTMSYSVTVGATALATTVDYSSPISVNCSSTTHAWFATAINSAGTTWSDLYRNELDEPSLAVTTRTSANNGVIAVELNAGRFDDALALNEDDHGAPN